MPCVLRPSSGTGTEGWKLGSFLRLMARAALPPADMAAPLAAPMAPSSAAFLHRVVHAQDATLVLVAAAETRLLNWQGNHAALLTISRQWLLSCRLCCRLRTARAPSGAELI